MKREYGSANNETLRHILQVLLECCNKQMNGDITIGKLKSSGLSHSLDLNRFSLQIFQIKVKV